MFNIELTNGQKFQIVFIIVVLGIAGFMMYHMTRKVADTTVTAWQEDRKFGVNPARPIGANNPEDPKGLTRNFFFACTSGRIIITQYPNKEDAGTKISYQSDVRQMAKGGFFADPMSRVKSIADPYKHALAVLAYNLATGNIAVTNYLRLKPDQTTAEQAAREKMLDGIAAIDSGAESGTFHKDMFDKIMAALEKYKSTEGDPTKGGKKAAAAGDVIDAATAYLKKMDDEKTTIIDAYMAAVDAVLTTPDDHTALINAIKMFEENQGRRGGGARGRGGRAGAGNNPGAARGGAAGAAGAVGAGGRNGAAGGRAGRAPGAGAAGGAGNAGGAAGGAGGAAAPARGTGAATQGG